LVDVGIGVDIDVDVLEEVYRASRLNWSWSLDLIVSMG
jgi:hypothetical protein